MRHLLRHRWQGFLALTGIALGVAVILAVELANQASRAAFQLAAARLQGEATHRLIQPGGALSEALYVQLKREPGCPPMAPVVTDWVRLSGQAGRYRLVGVDLFAEALFRGQLAAVAQQSAMMRDFIIEPGALVLDAGTAGELDVRVGDRLMIDYPDRGLSLRLLGIDSTGNARSRDLLIVDVATAQEVLGMPGRLTHIDLILDAGDESWLAKRLPVDVELVTVTEQAAGMTRMSAAFELNLTAMSLLALLVGTFLIFNAMNFSVLQRRTLLGRLRAVGLTPRELFRLMLGEALIIGMAGTLAGLLLGILLSQGLTRLVAATISELYYHTSVNALHLDGLALLKAGGLGIAATLLATLIPARLAANTPPLTTMSRVVLEQAAHGRLWRVSGIGLMLLVTGLVVALVVPGGVITGFTGLFLLVIGSAMVTPVAIHGLHRLLVSRPLPLLWRMGVRDLDRHLSRLGIAVAALMVALSAGVGVGVMVDSMRGAVNTWLSELLTADVYLASAAHEDGAVLDPKVIREVSASPAVRAVSRYRQGGVQLSGRQVGLIGAHLSTSSRRGFALLSGDEAAVWEGFDRGGLLISEPLAYHLGLERGDLLALPTAAGPVGFTVSGIFRDYASEHGRIFMEETAYREHWSGAGVSSLALFATGGDVAGMRRALGDLLTGHQGLVITSAGAILEESMAVFDRTFRVTGVLRILLLIVAFIGVFGALMALQLERSKEYAVLRALGMMRAQIAALIGGESLVMGLVAACIAVPSGLLMAWLLIESVQRRAFGWTMSFEVQPWLILQVILVGMGAAVLAALYPAWRSSARDPAPRLRED